MRVPRKEYARSRHQRLFEENVGKTGKDAIYELFSESKIGEVVAAQLAQASRVASSRSNRLLEESSGGPKWAWVALQDYGQVKDLSDQLRIAYANLVLEIGQTMSRKVNNEAEFVYGSGQLNPRRSLSLWYQSRVDPMTFATSPSPPTFNYNQTLVPIFNGEAYDYWSIQMQTLFISQDLWDVIENGYPVPEIQEKLATWTATKQKEYKQNKQHDAKALLFIQQGVSREIFPRIMQAKNAKEAWETLKNEIKGTDKMHRLPFPKTSWRAKAPLQLVHADIWGPSSTPSFGGRRYFLLFVDDYTRMMWVYFIQQKSDAFFCFKEFKALVKKQSGHSLKILRTDRGEEFNGHIFINFFNDHGIKKELTVCHTPQQNGVAERKNITIVEVARSML
ncbi:Retrovirus-related Pol polyprotein from transposon TNT 1-94 [Glycine soja]|uniref:Retrovirus-related Pol polyprotein from transposon TNT 1-94 n=1 Tax=Glycine soja TaxID=3848 RepID=A0A445KLC4_GLYSO|nr:Retrovirus-related Pol polyprotein from transposon TNT 1-94 [Glycine soja]